jgi:hypothetical protein
MQMPHRIRPARSICTVQRWSSSRSWKSDRALDLHRSMLEFFTLVQERVILMRTAANLAKGLASSSAADVLGNMNDLCGELGDLAGRGQAAKSQLAPCSLEHWLGLLQ